MKTYLRWIVLGITLFFVFSAFRKHWENVRAVQLDFKGISILAIAFLMTLLAHIWSGWVWTWILKAFRQPVGVGWALQVYLITNIGKYLPGNVGHFYARIVEVSKVGTSLSVASISVLLEPILMAAAALLVALFSSQMGWIKSAPNDEILALHLIIFIFILTGIHPKILNLLIHVLSRLKNKENKSIEINIEQYPWLPLLGELGFVLLRGTGFVITWIALMPVTLTQVPVLLSAFSFGWLMGLIVPGAPGGVGVFEATAIALLHEQPFPVGIMLTAIALFRAISILAELVGAGLAWLSRKLLADS